MSQKLYPPKPVKLIVGMLCRGEELFARAEALMQAAWGPVDIHGPVIPFTYTAYYDREMGKNLLRKFVSFDPLIEPNQIAAIKHQSNQMEDQLAQIPAGLAYGVVRPANLDPGYIEPGKLVLVTTKNYSHRIYVGENMYAEPTLHYHQGRWQSWPFTYPDYGSGDYFPFLEQARNRLMEQRSSKS